MSINKWKACWISLLVIGALQIAAFGVIGWVLIPMFYSDDVVEEVRTLYGETGAGEHWKKFGLPSYEVLEPTLLHVRLFNVTNPGDIMKNGMKPILKEVGPYVYMVEKITETISRNVEEKTTEFKQKTFYHFSRVHSPEHLHETDIITVLNVPYMEIVGRMSKVPAQNRLLTSLLVAMTDEEDTVFIRRPVGEILFTGFSQPSLGSIGKLLGNESTKLNGFSFIQPENGTESPVYKVYTGHTRTKGESTLSALKFGDIVEYGGAQQLPYWADSYGGKCTKIGGNVDGMIFEPLNKAGGTVTTFHPEMCRTVMFRMNGHAEEITPTIKSYRYVLNPEQLKDSKESFDNSCYCPREGVLLTGCVQAGTISNCREGFPFITTLPHFLDADNQQFTGQIVGLKPDRDMHESYIDLEPITGLASFSNAKFQLNFPMTPLPNNEDTKSLPNVLLPILWTAEVKQMNGVFKNIIEANIYEPLSYWVLGMWAALLTGVVFILSALFIMIFCRKRTASSRQASIMAVTGSKISKEVPVSGDDKAAVPLITNSDGKAGKLTLTSENTNEGTSNGETKLMGDKSETVL